MSIPHNVVEHGSFERRPRDAHGRKGGEMGQPLTTAKKGGTDHIRGGFDSMESIARILQQAAQHTKATITEVQCKRVPATRRPISGTLQ